MASTAALQGRCVKDLLAATDKRSQLAANWLSEQAIVTQDGFVGDAFLALKTTLRQPTPVGDCASRISIMGWLRAREWRATDSAKTASLEQRVFFATAPLEYFILLRDHGSYLQQYDGAYVYRRPQSKAYYQTLLTLVQNPTPSMLLGFNSFPDVNSSLAPAHTCPPPESEEYVAPGHKLEFYQALTAFFQGAVRYS